MYNWFECVITCEKQDEKNEKLVKTKQTYLVDAMTFTEAEARMLEKVKQMPRGDYEVKKMQPVKISDVIDTGSFNKWYKVKVALIDTDNKGKVKKTTSISIVHADDTAMATANVNEFNKNSQADYIITEVKEYDLLDYFPYNRQF